MCVGARTHAIVHMKVRTQLGGREAVFFFYCYLSPEAGAQAIGLDGKFLCTLSPSYQPIRSYSLCSLEFSDLNSACTLGFLTHMVMYVHGQLSDDAEEMLDLGTMEPQNVQAKLQQ